MEQMRIYIGTEVYIGDLVAVIRGDDAQETDFWRELRGVIDALNDAIPEYAVSLIYHDTSHFLTFERNASQDQARPVCVSCGVELPAGTSPFFTDENTPGVYLCGVCAAGPDQEPEEVKE